MLHVNPNKPPYSILALQQLWKDTSIRVSSYLHSTAPRPIPLIFPITTKSSKSNILELTVIWKDGKIKSIDFIRKSILIMINNLFVSNAGYIEILEKSDFFL